MNSGEQIDFIFVFLRNKICQNKQQTHKKAVQTLIANNF